MRISDIVVGSRFRADLGDLPELAESIQSRGLIHPPVVTTDDRLVCGYRRLKAAELLGWEEIEVRVFNPDDLLLAEHDENEFRKAFTVSERVAILKAVKERIGNRQGQRTDTELPANWPEVDAGKETREVAAKAAGFSSTTDARRAETVVEKGVPELIEKVDAGEIAVSVAADIATAPPAEQRDVIAEPDEKTVLARAREIKDRRKKQRRAEREKVRAQAAEQAATIPMPDDCGIRHEDFRDVMESLPDNSVDLIFTDPPYDRGAIPMYGDMARHAERVLKPGGSLVTYLGSTQLPDVLSQVTPHLRFWWTAAVRMTGQKTRMWEYGIVVNWKPLLWFVKGTRGDKLTFVDDLIDSEPAKDFHDWQQGESEAAYYIEKLTLPGGMVLDPFCGGGTTAVVAKKLGRQWLTCDTDESSVAISRKRVFETTMGGG